MFTTAGAAKKVTCSLGWVMYGRDLGWLVVRYKGYYKAGYYKAEGLDVNIVRGFGGADTAEKLGAGAFDAATDFVTEYPFLSRLAAKKGLSIRDLLGRLRAGCLRQWPRDDGEAKSGKMS